MPISQQLINKSRKWQMNWLQNISFFRVRTKNNRFYLQISPQSEFLNPPLRWMHIIRHLKLRLNDAKSSWLRSSCHNLGPASFLWRFHLRVQVSLSDTLNPKTSRAEHLCPAWRRHRVQHMEVRQCVCVCVRDWWLRGSWGVFFKRCSRGKEMKSI